MQALKGMPATLLADELQRRGWTVQDALSVAATSSRALRSPGTSTACMLQGLQRHDLEGALTWVEASTTGAAHPSSWARSQLMAVTHQRSPGTRPGKWYCGIGVPRSFPIERWCSRNSEVTTAQMVWLPSVLGTGGAAAVPVEAGHRIGAARLQLVAEHVAVRHDVESRVCELRG